MKVVKPKNTNGTLKTPDKWLFTYYQHDAQGNVLAIYDIADKDATCGYEMYLSQHVLYGSARLGVTNYGKDIKLGTMAHSFPYYAAPGGFYACVEHVDNTTDLISTVLDTDKPVLQSSGGKLDRLAGWDWGILSSTGSTPISGHGITDIGTATASTPTIVKVPVSWKLGRKQYEFSNHLGNVLVTVSDMPKGIDSDNNSVVDYYMPDVLTVSDYEPFGAPLENRTESENLNYRFGFNGQMKDNEVSGEGNTYEFEYRIYDTRIGRFLSVDPLAPEYAWNSPYAFAENKVIWGKDLEGKELSFVTDAVGDFIIEQVNAMDIHQDLKNSIAFTVGLYQSAAYIGDPLRVSYDQLNMCFQSLKTGIPLILHVVQKGSITMDEAKKLGLSIPHVQLINSKLEQINQIKKGGSDGYKEAGKLTTEIINILVGLKMGAKGNIEGAAAESKDLYRFDTRSPAEIEASGGFDSWGVDMSLERHTSGESVMDKSSGYVSTTTSPEVAQKFAGKKKGYIYRIQEQVNGVDVNKKLGDKSPYPKENEVAIPLNIPKKAIKSSRKIN